MSTALTEQLGGEKLSVGSNIKRIREGKGLTQPELGEFAGVSTPMICQIERGTRNPSLQVSAEIARALGCTLEELLGEREVE